MISFLVAMDNNHVIGCDNQMPWHLPDDLKHFKKKTMGHTIIMGRKTFESIGRVLPGRKNVVITRDKTATFPDGVKVIHDIETVNRWNNERPDEEFFVIGGGGIYEQMLPYADRLYITKIDASFLGDTYFPHFSKSDWTKTAAIKGKKDEKNPYDYYYLQYDRK
ncbi:MAG TPA: dihydrofolate reductase [Bacillota bacterium]|nr:dihydrofolate reductase [Bacillota bacterium]